jgi:hypothetical protein
MDDGQGNSAIRSLRKELRHTRQRLFALEAESRLRWAGNSRAIRSSSPRSMAKI